MKQVYMLRVKVYLTSSEGEASVHVESEGLSHIE
jgi:hypothetical protein